MASAESGWHVVVQIGSGQPELQAALAPLPARARAERLRQLALVGLYSLRFGLASVVHGPELSGRRILRLRDALDRSPEKPVRSDVLDLWRTSAVLDLVSGPESRGNYNAWYRDARQSKVQLADLTVAEVRTLQDRLVRRNGGSAVGRYQIIDDTLDGLIARMGLSAQARFTPTP